jgi:hypothetical protein
MISRLLMLAAATGWLAIAIPASPLPATPPPPPACGGPTCEGCPDPEEGCCVCQAEQQNVDCEYCGTPGPGVLKKGTVYWTCDCSWGYSTDSTSVQCGGCI